MHSTASSDSMWSVYIPPVSGKIHAGYFTRGHMQRSQSTTQNSPSTTKTTSLDWNSIHQILPEDTTGLNTLLAIREKWISHLKLLRSRHEILNSPTEDQIKSFAICLLKEQNLEHHPRKYGSWPLIEFENEADARVEFIYFTSYTAIAYLSLVRQSFPDIADSIDGFNSCLRKGLRFICRRQLRGHGYDSTIELIEAVKILSFGKVFTLIQQPEFASFKFHQTVISARQQIIDNIERRPAWGSIDIDEGMGALQLLSGADSDFESVRDTLYMDWALRRKTAFCVRLTDEISKHLSEMMWEDIQAEMKSLMDDIGDELEQQKPKFTVFERCKREFETEPRVLSYTGNVRDVIDNLESYKDLIQEKWFWSNFDQVIAHMKNDIRVVLKEYLALEVVDDRGFIIKLSWVDIDDNGKISFMVKGVS